jgi:putative transposase
MVKKKVGTIQLNRRAEMIERDNKISVNRQCFLLDVSPSRIYYKKKEPVDTYQEVKVLMRMIWMQMPSRGARYIRAELRKEGFFHSRKKVSALMKEIGIYAVRPKPNLSKSAKKHKKYPYLLRGVKIVRPNQVWSTDITYIPTRYGFIYLVAIIDWFSRKVLSWRLSTTLDNSFCVDALHDALSLYGKPEIFNTDQGSHFTANNFVGILEDLRIKISMDGKGRALDNIYIERLWRTVKYEHIFIWEFDSIDELRVSLRDYFHLYNYERGHQSLGEMTPDEVYNGRYYELLTEVDAV